MQDTNPCKYETIHDKNNILLYNGQHYQMNYMEKSVSQQEVKDIETTFIEKDEGFFKCKMHGGVCWAGSGRDTLFKTVKYHMQKYFFKFFV